MLTYNLTNIGSDSLYEYLYKCIKKDIVLGNIKPGERLPSKRPFSKNLGVSIITVENAYSLLMSEGFIYSLPKKGFYVTDLKNIPSKKQMNKEKVILTSGHNHYLADFSSNQTESDIFPFTTWLKKEFKNSVGHIIAIVVNVKWSDYDEKNTLQVGKNSFFKLI